MYYCTCVWSLRCARVLLRELQREGLRGLQKRLGGRSSGAGIGMWRGGGSAEVSAPAPEQTAQVERKGQLVALGEAPQRRRRRRALAARSTRTCTRARPIRIHTICTRVVQRVGQRELDGSARTRAASVDERREATGFAELHLQPREAVAREWDALARLAHEVALEQLYDVRARCRRLQAVLPRGACRADGCGCGWCCGWGARAGRSRRGAEAARTRGMARVRKQSKHSGRRRRVGRERRRRSRRRSGGRLCRTGPVAGPEAVPVLRWTVEGTNPSGRRRFITFDQLLHSIRHLRKLLDVWITHVFALKCRPVGFNQLVSEEHRSISQSPSYVVYEYQIAIGIMLNYWSIHIFRVHTGRTPVRRSREQWPEAAWRRCPLFFWVRTCRRAASLRGSARSASASEP